MSVEENRQILYAALLKYSPEVGSLRERVLDRVVLVALLGSSSSHPMQLEEIQNLTRVDPKSPALRTDITLDTIERLVKDGKVGQAPSEAKHLYYLTDTGQSDTDEAAASASQLFRPVLARMLQNTSGQYPEDVGEVVCRTFISECFARFGQQIAKAITGELTTDQLIGAANVAGAFHAAIANVSLPEEAINSLRARCIRFLRSSEQADERLKFKLTQGYYVAQLLGLNSYEFNPLSEDAFRGSLFYIDTNILLGRLLSNEIARLFDELVRICNALDIDLRVSRATIDETRRVAFTKLENIDELIDKIPAKLMEKTRDDILDAFLEEKSHQSDLTGDLFLERFDHIPSLLKELRIELYDHSADQIVGNQDLSSECSVINNAAITTRGWGKSEQVCLHDACHYLLVKNERTNGRRAWFLTRDNTLSQAAKDLDQGQLPFCFPLAGFLQSVSPFLEAPDAQHSLVDLFSSVLDGEIGDLSGEALFNLTELKIISEFHSDVFSAPEEELVAAFDYVKKNVLEGRPLKDENHTKVALELKKFFTSSKDERQKALEMEAARQKGVADSERQKREHAEQITRQKEAELERLRSEAVDAFAQKQIADSEREKRIRAEENAKQKEAQVVRLESEAEKSATREAEHARRDRRLAAIVAIMGSVLTSIVWAFDAELLSLALEILDRDRGIMVPAVPLVRLAASVILVGSFVPVISSLDRRYAISTLTVITAIAVGGSKLIGPSLVSTISGYLAIAAPIALVLMMVLRWSRAIRQ